MARLIPSDRFLINREGIDYQTTYGEINPVICDLPLLPGEPDIALNGEAQTEPGEPGEP